MPRQFNLDRTLSKSLSITQKNFLEKFYVYQSKYNKREKKYHDIFKNLSLDSIANKHKKNSNLEKALREVVSNFKNIKINALYILNIHSQIISNDKESVSSFRTKQNYILNHPPKKAVKLVFTPIPHTEVSQAINELCSSLNGKWKNSNTNKLYLSLIFYADFTLIHPFLDGNGRVGRFLITVLLMQDGFDVLKHTSLENIIHKRRGLYYDSWHKTNIGWHEEKCNYWHIVLDMLLTLQEAYKEVDKKFIIEGYKQNHNQSWLEQALLYSIVPYRLKDISNALSDIDPKIIQQEIDKLVSQGKLVKLSPGDIYKSNIL